MLTSNCVCVAWISWTIEFWYAICWNIWLLLVVFIVCLFLLLHSSISIIDRHIKIHPIAQPGLALKFRCWLWQPKPNTAMRCYLYLNTDVINMSSCHMFIEHMLSSVSRPGAAFEVLSGFRQPPDSIVEYFNMSVTVSKRLMFGRGSALKAWLWPWQPPGLIC